MKRSLLSILFVCAFLCLSRLATAIEPISDQQFAKLHALIKPVANEEKWNQIPWMSSLWEARKRAAAEGKPILLWEMDGNPLGCT